MKITVVIPTHRRPASLSRLLASLTTQTLSVQDYEIIVVRNLEEPEDILLLYKDKLPLRWLHTGILGVNIARNAGIHLAKGEIILFFDDDIELTNPQLLQKHWDFHQMHPDVDGLSGTYSFPPNFSHISFAYHIIATTWLYRYRNADGQTPYLIGGHASYKKKIFLENFRFSNEIAFGASETEFNYRLHLAGKRLEYHPNLTVMHYAQITLKDLMRKAFLQGYHSSIRKQTMGQASPLVSHSVAKKIVLSHEPLDLSAHWDTKLAWRLFDFSYNLGEKEALGKNTNKLRSFFINFIGAKGKY